MKEAETCYLFSMKQNFCLTGTLTPIVTDRETITGAVINQKQQSRNFFL